MMISIELVMESAGVTNLEAVLARRFGSPPSLASISNSWRLRDEILEAIDNSATPPPYTHDTLLQPPNMSKTQWKEIPVVPTSQEFLDIVLSRTYVLPPK